MVKINGEEVRADGIYLKEYLESQNYDIRRIAVEINDKIVPKSTYADIILHSGDVVEIVSFVGGG